MKRTSIYTAVAIITAISASAFADGDSKKLRMSNEEDSLLSPNKIAAEGKTGEDLDFIKTGARLLKPGYKGQRTLNSNHYPLLSMKVAVYRAEAEKTQKTLRRVLESIAHSIGNGTVADVPKQIKTHESTFRKLTQGLSYDPRALTDLARGTLVFQNMEDLERGLKLIKAHFEIEREVNRFETPWEDGYRDIQLIVKDKENGLLAEVQLHLCFLKQYTEGESHKIYEQVRAIKGEARQIGRALTPEEQQLIEKLNEQSREGYRRALLDAASGKVCHFSRNHS